MGSDDGGVERRHHRFGGRRRTDRAWLWMVAFVAILAIALSTGTLLLAAAEHIHTRQIDRLDHNLRIAALTQCARVNTLRIQVNGNEQRIHDGLQIVAVQMDQFIIDAGSSPHLREVLLNELANLANISAHLTTTPATNCVQAVDHPNTYAAPRAHEIPTFIPRTGP